MRDKRIIRNAFFTLLMLFASPFATLSQPYAIGSLNTTYVDPARNNRQIPVAIYYPALSPGNTVPVAPGHFPVVSFGHGFVMVHTAYKYLWEALVPLGYIVAFPLTESSAIPAPSHIDFGLDIAFVAQKIVDEGVNNASSLFYGHVKNQTALMGHSMGGGSAYLGAAADTTHTTLVTFAAANTSPSAILAATEVNIPTLLFAGQNDCITPPSLHQQPLYDSTSSPHKVMITILGGGHCYFADYNFNCSLGELTCSPQPTISRSQQQQTTLDFLIPWLDYTLNEYMASWQLFYDSLKASNRIVYQMSWSLTGKDKTLRYHKCRQPLMLFGEKLDIDIPSIHQPVVVNIYNLSGRTVFEQRDVSVSPLSVDTSHWPAGLYILQIAGSEYFCAGKIIRR